MDQALASEAAYCARMNWPRLRALVAQVCALVGWAGQAAQASADASLPAYLRLAALRLIRPAEAMARRLVILAAMETGIPRYIAHCSPPASPSTECDGTRHRDERCPRARPSDGPALKCAAIAQIPDRRDGPSDRCAVEGDAYRIIRIRSDQHTARRVQTGKTCQAARKARLPLTDTLPGFPQPHNNQRRVPDAEVPRIHRMEAGAVWTPPLVGTRDADRAVEAARTFARLTALQTLLDNPAPAARRMARWLARSAAIGALPPEHRRPARISPLRPGRPPGYRQRRGDRFFASALSEVHRICALALERPPPDFARAQAAS